MTRPQKGGWWRSLFGQDSEPLRAVPAIRRMKNYAAESGYAYEYFFEGYRERSDAREYVFTVSGDRKNWFALSVFAPALDRPDNERYAVAKLALFAAFDGRDDPAAMREDVRVSRDEAQTLLAKIGIE